MTGKLSPTPFFLFPYEYSTIATAKDMYENGSHA